MERPELETWRRTYQETVYEILEMYDQSPRYLVEPYGMGGPTYKVGDLSRDEKLSCARREAEITMNRVANTRKL